MELLLLILSSSLFTCFAFRPEYTMYSQHDLQGNSITLRSKQRDLLSLAPDFILNEKSSCYKGRWVWYDEKDFRGSLILLKLWDVQLCYNETGVFKGSARFLGPMDTNTPTISFYSGYTFRNLDEFIVEGKQNATIPFSPLSFHTTGFTNWTLYDGEDFTGSSICFLSTEESHYEKDMRNLYPNVKSVSSGCNEHVNNVYGAKLQYNETQFEFDE